MTKNECLIKIAEMILTDWRSVMLANEDSKGIINIRGDTVDISYRAFQKASEIMDDFISEENGEQLP